MFKLFQLNYLLLGEILLCLLLLHTKLVVHLLPSFTDVFSFAQLVHVGQTLSGLSLGFYQDVFDLWIVLEMTAMGTNEATAKTIKCYNYVKLSMAI